MDEIILERLSTFAPIIQTLSKEAQDLCACHLWSNDEHEKSTIVASKLQSMLNRFNNDLYQYFNTAKFPNADEISKLTTFQLEGEQSLAELNPRIKTKKDAQPTGQHSTGNRSKLPELNLQKFQGDALSWHQFWDQFESNIGQRNLNDVDKLLYLKASLEGPPKTIVDGLETNNNNYKIAVETLKERYGRKEKIVDAHYSSLYKIKQAVKLEDCRKTLDEIEKHLRVLQSLGEDTSHSSLRFLIMEKFPEDVIYEMRVKSSSESIEEMRKQLNILISAREDAKGPINKNRDEETKHTTETLHVRNVHSKNFVNPSKTRFTGRGRKPQGNNRPSTSAFAGSFVPRKRQHEFKRDDVPRRRQREFKRDDVPRKRQHEFKREETQGTTDRKRMKFECVFCQGSHYNDECTNYKTLNERMSKLTGRCFRCFRSGHRSTDCKWDRTCPHCKEKGLHNRALCPKMFSSETKTKQVNTLHVHNKGPTVLQTAVVEVTGPNGEKRKCRLLMDSGSQRSYVTNKIAKELHLEVEEEDHLFVFTFGAKTPREIDSHLVKLEIQTRTGKTKVLFANVVPSITQGIPYPGQELSNCTGKEKFILADDGSLEDQIDILIGNDYYYSLMSVDKIQLHENLYLINSEFGWILSGKLEDTFRDERTILTYFQSCYDTRLNKPDPPFDLGNTKCLWDLESIGITDSPNVSREDEAIKHFNETTTVVDNRYLVSWPWNEFPPDLQSNLGLAHGRLKSLLKRLDKESLLVYDQTLRDQLEKGIIERVPSMNKVDHPVHYLPHHGVSSPGKALRIVYDASAKTKHSKSLNECLYCGPIMLEDLTGLIIKFRCHNIGMTADVEKAFLQLGLHTRDRDVTRFLWMKDITKPATEENIVHYRFTRVPFGIISSPFLLNATIKHHLLNADSENVRRLANEIYVDNILTGADTVEEARDLYEKSKAAFQQISMNLREWSSNSKELMQHVPDASENEVVKTLGLNWDLSKDTLQLRAKNINNPLTKRGVLKTIASIYDPCGFAAPAVLSAKLLLQSLWEDKCQWDTPLQENVAAKWKNILEDLELIKDICLPRNILKHSDCQLHCFTDSSTQAYAAVVYIVQEDNVKFIIGKSRLVPIKDKDNLKIPRLELLGVLIGSRLMQYVTRYLQANITHQILWSDSQIVIDWYHSNKLLPPFVSRRIEEIKRNKTLVVRYVPSEFNSADVATRPIKSREELERWLSGPTFLLQHPASWPVGPIRDTSLLLGEGLTNNNTAKAELHSEEEEKAVEEDVVKPNEDQTIEIPNKTITPEDTDMTVTSEVREIRETQRQFFPDELNGKRTHLVRNLKLFTDVDGIIRCEGRLTHSDLTYDAKHPILLPKDCEFTKNIIRKSHEENHHVGVSHTLALVRQRFWIPQGRAQVQRVISRCPQCVKHGGGPYPLPATPTLPPERVKYESAFAYVGIDYFGPMWVKSDKTQEKRWICLFTCLVIRAVHLEIVKDMTAEECSLAFRRFIASRGVPTFILTDNALQFKLLSEIVTGNLSDKRIIWKFIPALAPWHGAAYERLVALVKHCLKRTLQKHLLGDNQLLTIMKEVEAVINTRPLTYVGTELEHILKPADFLTPGKCINLQNFMDNLSSSNTSTKNQLIEGWRRGETIINEYKDMFMNQYLLSLRERYHHSPKQPRVKSHETPCIGDIVQIKGEVKNRGNWKVGRITELLRGADGLCRVARVKVGDNIFTRSIAHLYPLEIEESPPRDVSTADRPTDLRASFVTELDTERNQVPVAETEELVDSSKESMSIDVTNNMNETIITDEMSVGANVTPEDVDANINEMTSTPPREERQRRATAVQAMEKIKEWTRHLMTTLTKLQ